MRSVRLTPTRTPASSASSWLAWAKLTWAAAAAARPSASSRREEAAAAGPAVVVGSLQSQRSERGLERLRVAPRVAHQPPPGAGRGRAHVIGAVGVEVPPDSADCQLQSLAAQVALEGLEVKPVGGPGGYEPGDLGFDRGREFLLAGFSYGAAAGPQPGLAQIVADVDQLGDESAQAQALRDPGLGGLHLRGGYGAAAGLAAHRAGELPVRPVAGVLRAGAATAGLTALAVRLYERARSQIADGRQLLAQVFATGSRGTGNVGLLFCECSMLSEHGRMLYSPRAAAAAGRAMAFV